MTQHRVSKAMEVTFNAVTAITDEFYRAHLDDHYGELARKAAATLARKSPSPLLKGNAKSWAGGILYALAKVNYLGGGEGQSFSSLGELCDVLGIGRSTGTAKGGEVIAALKIRPLDTKWLHPDVLAGVRLRDLCDNGKVWLMDQGLELSVPKGIALAMRVIRPAEFAMTTGVSVRMTDGVWNAVVLALGGSRPAIVQHGDRDQLADAIYRAGVKRPFCDPNLPRRDKQIAPVDAPRGPQI